MRNKGFNAPYFKSSVDKQKELFNVVNNVPHYTDVFNCGKKYEKKGVAIIRKPIPSTSVNAEPAAILNQEL